MAAAWLLLWFRLYRDPAENSRVSAAERAYILQEVPALKEKQVPWRALLPHRQTWAFLLGKVLTDPVWWFYLVLAARSAACSIWLTPRRWACRFWWSITRARLECGGRMAAGQADCPWVVDQPSQEVSDDALRPDGDADHAMGDKQLMVCDCFD